MLIRILSDGKPGHVNQSLGLARAIAARIPADIEQVDLTGGLISRIRQALRTPTGDRPDLVISAGRRTHIPLAVSARRFSAKSIVIMRPSLPQRLYDLIVVPEHDDLVDGGKILTTVGPINKISEKLPAKHDTGLILIGGVSKHYGWDSAAVAHACQHIAANIPSLTWQATNSRRTPADFSLSHPKIAFIDHAETAPDWLPEQLAHAKVVWVTPDSASMVYEALTAGCAVGLLPLPERDQPSRVAQGIADLLDQGRVSLYPQTPPPPTDDAFHEAARAADVVIQRLHLS